MKSAKILLRYSGMSTSKILTFPSMYGTTDEEYFKEELTSLYNALCVPHNMRFNPAITNALYQSTIANNSVVHDLRLEITVDE